MGLGALPVAPLARESEERTQGRSNMLFILAALGVFCGIMVVLGTLYACFCRIMALLLPPMEEPVMMAPRLWRGSSF